MSLGDLFGKVSVVSAEETKRRADVAKPGDFTLLDVREPAEFEMGHLPGAVHIPLSQIADRAGELDRQRPIVTY